MASHMEKCSGAWRSIRGHVVRVRGWVAGHPLVDIDVQIGDDTYPPSTHLREDEIWNLNWHLADILADSLRRLRDLGNGYPMGLTEEIWRERLTTMADGFDSFTQQEDIGMPEAPYEALELLKEHWRDLWD